MIPDIDIFIGLSLDAKDNNYNPAVIKEKADWFNKRATSKQREEIIIPLIRARDPDVLLNKMIDDYSMKQKIKRGLH